MSDSEYTELTINELVRESYQTSCDKGWHPTPDASFAERIALIHSEASEALEEYRNGNALAAVYEGEHRKPEGVPIELADILIRVADLCGTHGIDLELALRLKLAYNKTREYRHGGKVI